MSKLTEQNMIDENRGYYDGIDARTMINKPHKSWPKGPHFNPHYERGYWSGFQSMGEGIPHPESHFEQFAA